MFVWKAEYELGIDSIDRQHMKLMELGNRIGHLLQQDSEVDQYDRILVVLDELKAYTVYHFDNEEKLFLLYDYPDFENHKKEHDGFIHWLDSIDMDTLDEKQKEVLKEILKKLINWVFKHVITTDFLYKDLLIRQGMR